MKDSILRVVGWFVLAFTLVVLACTPAQREAVRELAPPVVKAGCVLVRALADDETPREVCATAEDLLPLLDELLAEREERARVRLAMAAPPVEPTPVVAFAFPDVPKARAPRRRCVAWASAKTTKDAGAEGGASDGGR